MDNFPEEGTMYQIHQLKRLRWAVRLTLALGVAASVAANILHANPHPISQTIAAWPPLALLLTVELVSRIPVHRRWLAAVRVLATATIAAIAAWISYWHMAGTAARYGEDAAYLLPLTVDGLIVVASVSLVELAAKVRSVESADVHPVVAVQSAPLPAPVSPAPVGPLPLRPARRTVVSPLTGKAMAPLNREEHSKKRPRSVDRGRFCVSVRAGRAGLP